ncbi:DUF1016 N-terminal domain-containing protein [Aequorivita ciconiae]|uniref:DUF1016 N-terminal domain-containing protein n=1 Tax=Aequorivita ciconiae TaxID=2494375 RepID=UPI00196AA15A|nr:DUF1016 N-terminal domain-containing protein [Aequorivita sp. H23M31]
MGKDSFPKRPNAAPTFVLEIKTLIDQGKQEVAVAVNASMIQLYWSIGKRINQEVLENKRAEYGKQIVSTLSAQLTQEYGNSFSEKNI